MLSRIKVAYLIPEWLGQSHVWAWREICHLREMGIEVTLFSTRRIQDHAKGTHSFATLAEAQAHYLFPLSLRQIAIALLWGLRRPLRLFSCIRLGWNLPIEQPAVWRSLPLIIPACYLAQAIEQQHIEHLHTPIPARSAILCMMVKRLTDVPYSITSVADTHVWGGAMQEKFAEAAFVTVVGKWLAEQIHQDFPSLPPAFLTRHGVDTRKWNRSEASRCDRARIFSAGRLAPSKGFDVLLKAAAIVKSQGIEFDLHIAGDGEERPTLEALINDLDLSKEVTLLGSLSEDQCLAEMQDAHLFALASYSEGLGVVYLEAMAMQVATVGTAVGGVLEVIHSGSNGLLVPPGEPELFATAIINLLQDEPMRDRIAQAGRQTVVEHFDSRYGAEKLGNLMRASREARCSDPIKTASPILSNSIARPCSTVEAVEQS
jgi:glycosyltransferase involved in cell wall biosynthesis